MSHEDKTAILELVYLSRLKQQVLPWQESKSDAFSATSPECDDPECLPWSHTVKTCAGFRARSSQKVSRTSETPSL